MDQAKSKGDNIRGTPCLYDATAHRPITPDDVLFGSDYEVALLINLNFVIGTVSATPRNPLLCDAVRNIISTTPAVGPRAKPAYYTP